MTPDTYRRLCSDVRNWYESGTIGQLYAKAYMEEYRQQAYAALASNELDPSTKVKWAGVSFAQVDETAMLDI